MSAAIPPLAGRYFSSLCDPKIPQQRRLLAEQLMFIFENGGSYLGPSVPPAVRDLLTDIFLPFRSDQQYRKDATLSISIDSTAVAGRDTLAGALQECGDLLNVDGSTRPAPPDAPRLVCLAGLKVEILKLDISQRIKPGRAVVRGKMIDASMEESAASTPSAPSVKRRRRSPSGNSDYVDGGPSGDEDSGSSEDELSSAKGYDSESSMDVPLAKSRDKGKLAGKAQKRTTKGKGTGREVKGKRTGNASGQRKVVTVRGANKRARVSSENDSGEDADHGQSQRKARKVDAGETLENDEPAAPPSKAPVKPGMPASAPAALPSSAVSTRTTMSIALQSPMTLDQTKSDSSTPVPMEHTKNEKRKRTRVVLSSSPEPDVSAPAPAPASPTASPEPAAPSPDVLARKTRQARIEQQEQAHWDTQAKGLAKWKGKGQWENTWREAGRDGELPSIMVPPGGIEHVYFLGTRMKIVTFAFLRSCNIRARISPDNATIIIVASRPGTYRVSDEVREYLALAKRTGAVVVSDVWVESCEREQCFVPLEAYRVFDAPE